MKHIVFLIRAFNDVDHFTPLIHRVHQEPDVKPVVRCINPRFDLENNDNLRFLRDQCGVDVRHMYELLKTSGPGRLWTGLLEWHARSHGGKRFPLGARIGGALRSYCAEQIIRTLEGSTTWVDALFAECEPTQIVCDWVSPSSYAIRPILRKADKLGIPTFSIPHGMNIYSNMDVTRRTQSNRQLAEYDHVVSQGWLSRQHLEYAGTPSDRIVDLGSLRFCREWMTFFRDHVVTSTFDSPCDPSKLKVVFFLSKLHYKIDVNLLRQTIEVLAQNKDLHLIIKPHTRGMGVEFLSDLARKYHLNIQYDTSSVVLSEWSDVALVVGSSIALQTLFDGKLLVYPSYLVGNEAYFDVMKACWRVETVDELNEALRRAMVDRTYRPYSQENTARLFANAVYAGHPDRNVIDAYFEFVTTAGKYAARDVLSDNLHVS